MWYSIEVSVSAKAESKIVDQSAALSILVHYADGCCMGKILSHIPEKAGTVSTFRANSHVSECTMQVAQNPCH